MRQVPPHSRSQAMLLLAVGLTILALAIHHRIRALPVLAHDVEMAPDRHYAAEYDELELAAGSSWGFARR